MASLHLAQEIFNLIYPVGSVYLSVNQTNPGTLFGGTWSRITDGFLYCTSGNGGGQGNLQGSAKSAGTTLTASQIPKFAFQTPHVAYGEGAAAGITNVTHTFVSGLTPTSVNYEGARGTGQGYAEKYEFGGGGSHAHNIPYTGVVVWKRTA